MTKKKILVLSDHPLSPSGVGTQTKYNVWNRGALIGESSQLTATAITRLFALFFRKSALTRYGL